MPGIKSEASLWSTKAKQNIGIKIISIFYHHNMLETAATG